MNEVFEGTWKEIAERFKGKVIQTMGDQTVFVYCSTCGTVFLNITVEQYWELHFWGNELDKWHWETGIHFCENLGHEILMWRGDSGMIISISQQWRNRLKKRGETREQLLVKLLEHKPKLANKRI